ncbi:MAG: hypothetical protein P8Q15_05770 [Methylophilaceae bacterium]|nr:hypothetical protein [Methylophilaceae bacterium]
MSDLKIMTADLAESLMDEVNELLGEGVPFSVIESALAAVLWHMAETREECKVDADAMLNVIKQGGGTVH